MNNFFQQEIKKIIRKVFILLMAALVIVPSLTPPFVYAQSVDEYSSPYTYPTPDVPVDIPTQPPDPAPVAETLPPQVQQDSTNQAPPPQTPVQITSCQDHQVIHNPYVSCFSARKCHYDTRKAGESCITQFTPESPYYVDASQADLQATGCISAVPAPQPITEPSAPEAIQQPEVIPQPTQPAQPPVTSAIDWGSVISQSCAESPFPGSECESFVSTCGRGKNSALEYNRCLTVFIREPESKSRGGLGLGSEAEVSDPSTIDYAALQPIIDASSQAAAVDAYNSNPSDGNYSSVYSNAREESSDDSKRLSGEAYRYGINPDSPLGQFISASTPIGPAVPEGFKFDPGPGSQQFPGYQFSDTGIKDTLNPYSGTVVNLILNEKGQQILSNTTSGIGNFFIQAPANVGNFFNQAASTVNERFSFELAPRDQAEYDEKIEQLKKEAEARDQVTTHALHSQEWEDARQKIIAAGGKVEGTPEDFTITLPSGKVVKPNSPEFAKPSQSAEQLAQADQEALIKYLKSLELNTANLVSLGFTGLLENTINTLDKLEANNEKIDQLKAPANSVVVLLAFEDQLKLGSTASQSDIDEVSNRVASYPYARVVYLRNHPDRSPAQVTDEEIQSDIADRVKAWHQLNRLQRENARLVEEGKNNAIGTIATAIPDIATLGAGTQLLKAAAGSKPASTAIGRFLRTGSFTSDRTVVKEAAEAVTERTVAQVIKDGDPVVVSTVFNTPDIVTIPPYLASSQEMNAAELGREVLINAGVPAANLPPANLFAEKPEDSLFEKIKKLFKKEDAFKTESAPLESLVAATNQTEKLTPGQVEIRVINALDGLNGVTEQTIKERLLAQGYSGDSVDQATIRINNLLKGSDVREQGIPVVHIDNVNLSAQTQIGVGKYGNVLVNDSETTVTKIFRGDFVEPNSPGNLNEIRVLQVADGIGGLPKIQSVITDSTGVVGYQMEYIPGKTLKKVALEGGTITRLEAEQLIKDLDDIYERTTTLHGDLHLDNVIIQETTDAAGNTTRQLRLIDYGSGEIQPPTVTKSRLDINHGYEVDGTVGMVLQTFEVGGKQVRLLDLPDQEATDFVKGILKKHYDDDLAQTMANRIVTQSKKPTVVNTGAVKTLTATPTIPADFLATNPAPVNLFATKPVPRPAVTTTRIIQPTDDQITQMEQVIKGITEEGRDAADLNRLDYNGKQTWGNQNAWTIDDVHTPEARNSSVIYELKPETIDSLNIGEHYNYIVAVDPKTGEVKVLVCREVDNCRHITLAGEVWQVRTDIPPHAAADPSKVSEYIGRPDIKIVRSGQLIVDNQGRLYVDLQSGAFSSYGDVTKYPGWNNTTENFGKVEDIFQGITGRRTHAVSVANPENPKFDPTAFLKEARESNERASQSTSRQFATEAQMNVDLTTATIAQDHHTGPVFSDRNGPAVPPKSISDDALNNYSDYSDAVIVDPDNAFYKGRTPKTEKQAIQEMNDYLDEIITAFEADPLKADSMGYSLVASDARALKDHAFFVTEARFNEATNSMAQRVVDLADSGKIVIVYVKDSYGGDIFVNGRIMQKVEDFIRNNPAARQRIFIEASSQNNIAQAVKTFGKDKVAIVTMDDITASGQQMGDALVGIVDPENNKLKGGLREALINGAGLTETEALQLIEANLIVTLKDHRLSKPPYNLNIRSYYALDPYENVSRYAFSSTEFSASFFFSDTDYGWRDYLSKLGYEYQQFTGKKLPEPIVQLIDRPYKGGTPVARAISKQWEAIERQYKLPDAINQNVIPTSVQQTAPISFISPPLSSGEQKVVEILFKKYKDDQIGFDLLTLQETIDLLKNQGVIGDLALKAQYIENAVIQLMQAVPTP